MQPAEVRSIAGELVMCSLLYSAYCEGNAPTTEMVMTTRLNACRNFPMR